MGSRETADPAADRREVGPGDRTAILDRFQNVPKVPGGGLALFAGGGQVEIVDPSLVEAGPVRSEDHRFRSDGGPETLRQAQVFVEQDRGLDSADLDVPEDVRHVQPGLRLDHVEREVRAMVRHDGVDLRDKVVRRRTEGGDEEQHDGFFLPGDQRGVGLPVRSGKLKGGGINGRRGKDRAEGQDGGEEDSHGSTKSSPGQPATGLLSRNPGPVASNEPLSPEVPGTAFSCREAICRHRSIPMPSCQPVTPRPRRPRSRGAAWYLPCIACFLAGCVQRQLTLPPPAAATGADQFVDTARKISAEKGLVEAREYLAQAFAERDDSDGEMEARLMAAAADPKLVYPDSFAALPAQRRERIGFAFVPGLRTQASLKPSKPVQAFAAATGEAERFGFQARLIPAVSRVDDDKNSASISAALTELCAQSDAVVILAKSKGAHDLIQCLGDERYGLRPEDRSKLKAICFLAGTVQGSFVATWFARHHSPWATGGRAMMIVTGRGKRIGMLENMGQSPWQELPEGFPRSMYPDLKFICLVVLPDGEDGRPVDTVWSPFFAKEIQKTSGWESPHDSLVESAAQVIPETVDAPEWIVRTRGIHAFPKGRFLNGERVAPNTPLLEDGTMNPDAGQEIMNAFLRSLPTSLLR